MRRIKRPRSGVNDSNSSNSKIGRGFQPENTCDQCIFCCEVIYAHVSLPQYLMPQMVESIPHVLNFRPQNENTWKGQSPQTLLCLTCSRIAAEGHQLFMLLAETQKNLEQVSSKLKAVIKNSFSEDKPNPHFMVSQTSATELRQELINSLQVKREVTEYAVHSGGNDNTEFDDPMLTLVKDSDDDDECFPHPTVDMDDNNCGNSPQDDETETVDGDSDAAENMGDDSMIGRRSSYGKKHLTKFSDNELALLLKLRSERSAELDNTHCKRGSIYAKIAKEMSRIIGRRITGDQCRVKIKNYNYKSKRTGEKMITADDYDETAFSQRISNKNEECEEKNSEGAENGDDTKDNSDFESSKTPSRLVSRPPVVHFTDKEVSVLISQFEANIKLLANDDVKDRRKVWAKIAKAVSEIHGVKRSTEQCRKKMKNLNYKYGKEAIQKRLSQIPQNISDEPPQTDEATFQKMDDSMPKYFPGVDETETHDGSVDKIFGRKFTEEETTVLVKEYHKNRSRLKRSGISGKKTMWEEIAHKVSSLSGVPCTQDQCRSKIKNLKAARRFVVADVAKGNIEPSSGTEEPSLRSIIGFEDPLAADEDFSHDPLADDELDDSTKTKELVTKDNKSHVMQTDPDVEKLIPFSTLELSVLLSQQKKYRDRLRVDNRVQWVTKMIWDKIARTISSYSGVTRTPEQCRRKLRNYNYKYRRPNSTSRKARDEENYRDYDSCLERTMAMPNGSRFRLKKPKLRLVRCDTSMPKPTSKRHQALPFIVSKLREMRQRKEQLTFLKKTSDRLNRKFPCLFCSKKFSAMTLRNQHVAIVHAKSPPERYSCSAENCSVSFTTTRVLERHIRDTHGGAFEHFCNIDACRQGFFTEAGLKGHKSSMHDESLRKFQCDKCVAKFRTPYLLTKHKEHKHFTTKKYVCDICSLGFVYQVALKNHEAKEHGKFKDQYTCPICGKTYAAKEYVRRHVRLVHPDTSGGKRKLARYTCKVEGCGRDFQTPAALQKHNLSHSGERNFQCDRCPSNFKYYNHLEYHLKRHDGLTWLQCPHCPRQLANSKSLKTHIEVLHEPEARFRCERCSEGFPCKKYYDRHKLICEQGYSGTSKRSSRNNGAETVGRRADSEGRGSETMSRGTEGSGGGGVEIFGRGTETFGRGAESFARGAETFGRGAEAYMYGRFLEM